MNQTRSTHHEGFCSIAGMQYRISSTSHTQTAATAVATELREQVSTRVIDREREEKKKRARHDAFESIFRSWSNRANRIRLWVLCLP